MAEVAPDSRWDFALRLLAGLHYLALSEGIDPWADPASVVSERAAWLADFTTKQGIQTNEVQRSWVLLPCFLEVARRSRATVVDFVELGSSAGLNLVWDRYRYVYERGSWGDVAASLELCGEERGQLPRELLRLQPSVRARTGIDRAPVDLTTASGALLLKSFVWADQRDRLARLERAIEVLRGDPPELVRGELVDALPEVLSRRKPDALTVVFETAVLAYLAPEERQQVLELLDTAGREGSLALVRSGRPSDGAQTHWALWLTLWPAGREEVAHASFHGAWLDWLA